MDFKKGLLILSLLLLICVSVGAVSAADADVDVSDVDNVCVVNNVDVDSVKINDVDNENSEDTSVQSVSASECISKDISNLKSEGYKISVNNVEYRNDINPVKITARVTNNGKVVNSGKVTFDFWAMDDPIYYYVKVNNGEASLTINPPYLDYNKISKKTFTCKATYTDSNGYIRDKTEFNVTNNKDCYIYSPYDRYAISVKNVTGKEGSSIKIVAKVTCNGKPINYGSVYFYLGTFEKKGYTVNVINGEAVLSKSLPNNYLKNIFHTYTGCMATYYTPGYEGKLNQTGRSCGASFTITVNPFYDSTSKTTSKSTTKSVAKSSSVVYCNSFTTHKGVRYTYYAYVWDKKTLDDLNGGTVTFKIAGKTYKRAVKNGVAKVTFTVSGAYKKYTCKATYSGKSGVQGSSKTFYMTIKPKPKPIYVTVKTTRYFSAMFSTTYTKKVKGYTIKVKNWNGRANYCKVTVQKNGKYYKPYVKYYYKYKGKTKVTKWRKKQMSISLSKTRYIKVYIKIVR